MDKKMKPKPCPFCGNKKPSVFNCNYGYPIGMRCKCGLQICFFKRGNNIVNKLIKNNDMRNAIIERWNRRVK